MQSEAKLKQPRTANANNSHLIMKMRTHFTHYIHGEAGVLLLNDWFYQCASWKVSTPKNQPFFSLPDCGSSVYALCFDSYLF